MATGTGDTILNLANSLVNREVLGKGLKSPLEEDDGTGDFKTIEGADNVSQCIKDLILTKVGERVMNEDFGTLLPDRVFDNQRGIIDIVPLQVQEAILRFEPRVAQVNVRAEPIGTDSVRVNISYTLKATGRRDNVVFPLFLETPGL